MTDKTKRIVLIAVCCLLCVAAAIGIAVRFGGNADISSGVVSDDPTQSGDPNVDIDNNSQTDLDVQVETPTHPKPILPRVQTPAAWSRPSRQIL